MVAMEMPLHNDKYRLITSFITLGVLFCFMMSTRSKSPKNKAVYNCSSSCIVFLTV